jgi:hypothetical protein
LKCKSWNISVVFCRGLPCHCYILKMFQSSFLILFFVWNARVETFK